MDSTAAVRPRTSRASSTIPCERDNEEQTLVADEEVSDPNTPLRSEEGLEAVTSLAEDHDIEAAVKNHTPGFFQRTKKDMRSRRTSSRRLEMLSAAVDCIQRLRVPNCVNSILRNDDRDARIIAGLDRVIFGTVSAAKAVRICGIKPPQYFWYMVSGSFCDVIQFILDVTIHFSLNVRDPSVCWALGFGLSIIFRHTSHRYLVFGDYVGGFWRSLIRMYGGYSIIIILSTIFNIVMTQYAAIPHYVAWIITLLWTGLVNYFILKKLWSFGGK